MPPRCVWPSHATNPQGLPAPHIAQLTRTTTHDALTPHPSHYLTYKGAIPPHALNYTRADPCPIAITIQASNNQGAQMPQPLANFRFLFEADRHFSMKEVYTCWTDILHIAGCTIHSQTYCNIFTDKVLTKQHN